MPGSRRPRMPCVAVCSALVLSWSCDSQRPRSGQASTPQQEAAQLLAQARKDVAAQKEEPADASGLYVPRAVERPRPLVVFLHGLGGSGQGLIQNLELHDWAEREQLVVLAPEGDVDYAGRRYWNATASCCDFDARGIDHVKRLEGWLEEATRLPQVDAKRMYLVGYSNGGFLAHRAACELGGRLRGIFSIAGAAPGQGEACPELQNEQPQGNPAAQSPPSAAGQTPHAEQRSRLSVVQIHGRQDPIVRFEGGYLFANRSRPAHPSAQQSVAGWARRNGCSDQLIPRGVLDLDPRIAGAETEVLGYAECRLGQVELWAIAGGDHSAGLSRYSLRAIARFIARQQ